jgi:hypothetical protein
MTTTTENDSAEEKHLKWILDDRWRMIDVYLRDYHIYSRDLGQTLVKKPEPLVAPAEEAVKYVKAELKKEIELALKIAFQEGVKVGMASERQRRREEKAGIFTRARQWILR